MATKKKVTLKSVTETVIKVQYYDLEEFIDQVTGHAYEVVASEEWGNDSQHRFAVDGKLSDYEQDEWDNFKKTGECGTYFLRTILNGLCSEKKIAPGNYLITVCW
jgi:hypothetical protein